MLVGVCGWAGARLAFVVVVGGESHLMTLPLIVDINDFLLLLNFLQILGNFRLNPEVSRAHLAFRDLLALFRLAKLDVAVASVYDLAPIHYKGLVHSALIPCLAARACIRKVKHFIKVLLKLSLTLQTLLTRKLVACISIAFTAKGIVVI